MIRPAIAWVMGGAGFLSGLMIVASMLVMSIEVFFRFALGKPTFWALEVSTYLLVATTCLGVGYTLRMRGHVGSHFCPTAFEALEGAMSASTR